MAYALNMASQQTIASGLGTWSYTILTQGPHSVSVFSQVPAPSGLIITINQNGSPIAPTPAPFQPSQSEANVMVPLDCSVGDVITIVLSSSISNDPSVPFIKSIINFHRGTN